MTDRLFDVSGQTVVISGGSRGIGRAMVLGFLDRSATVIATGREAGPLDELRGLVGNRPGKLHTRICDVSSKIVIDSFVASTLSEFNAIDTLINVAGVNRRKPAETLTEDDYDYVIDINLKGAFLLSQAVGKAMLARGSGNQINIASLNTDRPLKNVLPYAVSKAGISHMTKALALEWGPRGIRVNAIAPGFILTDLTRKLWSEPTMQSWGLANTPLRRMGDPDDLVGAAIFLASPASAFVTGQTLYVDGGFTCGFAWPIQ